MGQTILQKHISLTSSHIQCSNFLKHTTRQITPTLACYMLLLCSEETPKNRQLEYGALKELLSNTPGNSLDEDTQPQLPQKDPEMKIPSKCPYCTKQ
jgi:hypothetical protein